MKPTIIGLDFKYSQVHKPVKIQKQINPLNIEFSTPLIKPSSELFKAYSNVVPFKGNETTAFNFSALTATPNYNKYTEMFPVFNALKDGVMRNQNFAKLFQGYAVEEIVSIFDEMITNQKTEEFTKLINSGKNYPEASRNIGFKEAKQLINKNLTKREEVQQYLELTPNSKENKVGDVELKGTTDTVGVAKLIIKNGINKNLYGGFKYLTTRNVEDLGELSKVEIEKELKRQISINTTLSNGKTLSDVNEFKSHLTQAQLIKYENLMKDESIERPLEKDEILACVLLDLSSQDTDGFNQINYFINLRAKHTDLTELEIAHLVKLCINKKDENKVISTYKTLKSQEITFKDKSNTDRTCKLLPQEALLCASEELTEEQIKRFAQLRATTTEIDAVRQHNKSVKLSPQLIINYIKNNKTDEDIETELRLYKILEQGIDIDIATIISKSEDLTNMLFETDSVGNKVHRANTIVDYAKKGLKTRKQVDTYNVAKQTFDENTAVKYAQIGISTNIMKCQELMSKGIPVENAIRLANDEDAYNRYPNLLNSKIKTNLNDIVELATLGLDCFEQLEKYQSLKQNRADIKADTLTKIAKHNEFDNLFKLASLTDDKNKPIFSDYELMDIATHIGTNPDVSPKDFIENVKVLTQNRADIKAETLAQIANCKEFAKLFELASLTDEKNEYIFTDDELSDLATSKRTNPDVSPEDFIEKVKVLKQNRADIKALTLAVIANCKEFAKLFELASLTDDKNEYIFSNRELFSIAYRIGTNPDVSPEDFIENVKVLKQNRANIKADTLAKIANCKEFAKLFELASLTDDKNKPIFSDYELNHIATHIGTNPDVSPKDFIENVKNSKQKIANIPHYYPRLHIDYHNEFAKFFELASLTDEKNKYIFTNSELFNIAYYTETETNPDVSPKDFIENVKVLKQNRADIKAETLAKIANHNEFAKLFELASLTDEKNEYIFTDDELSNIAKCIRKNPDISPKDFIENVKVLKQKRSDIHSYHLANIANCNEFAKLFELASLTNEKNEFIFTDNELSDIAIYIVTNPDISPKDFIENVKVLKQKRSDIHSYHLANIANCNEFAKLFKLASLTNEKNELIFCSKNLNDIATDIGTNPDVSPEDFIENVKVLKQNRADIKAETLAKIANHKEFENITKLMEQGIKQEVALKVYSEEKYLNLLNTSKKLSPSQAAFLALNTSITSLDPKMLEKLGNEALYKITTGTDEQVFATLASAMLKLHTNQDVTSSKITDKEINLDTIPEKEACSFDSQTANFTYNGTNGFDVNLKKAIINDKQVMIIKNNQGDENYIAYDGAISIVKQPLYVDKIGDKYKVNKEKTQRLKDSLNSHSNISSKQTEILAEAVRHFILRIADNNGKCIISDGLTLPNGEVVEPFNGIELNDADTKQKYTNIFEQLGNSATAEDILKLMPKDSILQINPFITDANMLFSISAEWQSKDGTWWQMRIHSQDLKFINNPKEWIYRLGYTQNNDVYFYNPETSSFEEGMEKEKTHIKTTTQDDKSFNGKLIANPHFQNIFRNISSTFNELNEINYLAAQLGIKAKDKEEKINEILNKCYENIENYFRFKDEIDKILAQKGLSFF